MYSIAINNPSVFPHPLHKRPTREITCSAGERLAIAAPRETPEPPIHPSCRSQTFSGSSNPLPSHISQDWPQKTAHTVLTHRQVQQPKQSSPVYYYILSRQILIANRIWKHSEGLSEVNSHSPERLLAGSLIKHGESFEFKRTHHSSEGDSCPRLPGQFQKSLTGCFNQCKLPAVSVATSATGNRWDTSVGHRTGAAHKEGHSCNGNSLRQSSDSKPGLMHSSLHPQGT